MSIGRSGPDCRGSPKVTVDARAISFCVLLTFASGVVFGTIALFFATDQEQSALRQARGASVGRVQQLLRGGLVALEFALTVPLLLAAGLLIATLLRLQKVDPGFAVDGVLTARLALLEGRHPDPTARMTFWEQALTELRAIPGVKGAGLTTQMLPACNCYNNFDLLERPVGQDSEPQSAWVLVSSGLLETLGVPLSKGARSTRATRPTRRQCCW
jgi:hypothetical protein